MTLQAFASAQRLRHLPSGELAGAPAPTVIPAFGANSTSQRTFFVERLIYIPYGSSIYR